MLAVAGLAPDALGDPWEAWKVFKAFVRTPVEHVVADALVQYGVYRDPDEGGGEERAHLYLVREFSEVGPRGDGAEPATHLVCDLAFPPEALGGEAGAEFWTQDAPGFAAWVDRVEGAAGFQALMAARPTETSVYMEEA